MDRRCIQSELDKGYSATGRKHCIAFLLHEWKWPVVSAFLFSLLFIAHKQWKQLTFKTFDHLKTKTQSKRNSLKEVFSNNLLHYNMNKLELKLL